MDHGLIGMFWLYLDKNGIPRWLTSHTLQGHDCGIDKQLLIKQIRARVTGTLQYFLLPATPQRKY